MKDRRKIVCEGKAEDVTVRIVRTGSRITIRTERPGVAKSVMRAVVDTLAGKEPRIIGFSEE